MPAYLTAVLCQFSNLPGYAHFVAAGAHSLDTTYLAYPGAYERSWNPTAALIDATDTP